MRFQRITIDEVPFETKFEIAGCVCACSTNRADFLNVLLPWSRSHAVPSFEMRVIVRSGLLRDESAAPIFRGHRQFVYACFHNTESFLIDSERRVILASVSEETAADEGFWNTVVLPIAMGVLGPTMGVAPLHCACLEMNGHGLLIAGISGAGKSTLSTALAQKGAFLISDDWTYVRADMSGIVAHGLRVPVKLMPDTVRFFPQLLYENLNISLNGELAYEVDPAKSLGLLVKESCRPECFVFLERQHGLATTMERVDGAVVREFFLKSAEKLPPEMRSAEESRSRIIGQVSAMECWIFRYGGLPGDGADSLLRLIGEKSDVDRRCATAG